VIIIVILFYFLFPACILYLSPRVKLINKAGPVVVCYAAGLILGNTGILPEGMYRYQDMLTNITIPLAIPLLLFSLDVRSMVKMAGKTFLSLILGLTSTIIMIVAGYILLSGRIHECWKVAGMLTGVYSGGTPNLAALKIALNVDADTYILTHSYDVAVGAVVLLFMVSYAQRFFLLFMKPYTPMDKGYLISPDADFDTDFESYEGIFEWKTFRLLLEACVVAIGIIGISAGFSYLLSFVIRPKDPVMFEMTSIILLITTLGITASLFKRVNKIKKSFQAGMYFILVFCVVVASMADISSFSFDSWPILVYIIIAVPGSLLLHGILSRIFKVDVDNFLIISTALSMSPPFVPVVAGSLKNKDIIIPGLVVGIIGYAIGNYLGIMIAFILR
jgi:uncharacterized membrane protein